MVEFFIDEAHKQTQSKTPIVVAWDSIAGTPTQAELDCAIEDFNKQMGVHARLLSFQFRRITQKLAEKSALLICVNQLKQHMNVGGWQPPGIEELSKLGGRALNYHASMQIKVVRKAQIKTDQKAPPIGITVGIHMVKNKVGMPFRKADLRLIFNKGFDEGASMFPFMIEAGIVTGGGGGWYDCPLIFGSQRVHEADITNALVTHPEHAAQVRKLLLTPESQNVLDEKFRETPNTAPVEQMVECSECGKTLPEGVR